MSLSASRFLRVTLIAGCTVLAGLFIGQRIAAARVSGSASPLPHSTLSLNNHIVSVEVADTDARRATGLMHRKTLAEDHGMLFVFPDDQPRCFWMKNTHIPLSIAFIDAQGAIVALDEMQPLSEETHCSGSNAKYALEMNQNWFRHHGVRVGDNIEAVLPDTLPTARDETPASSQ